MVRSRINSFYENVFRAAFFLWFFFAVVFSGDFSFFKLILTLVLIIFSLFDFIISPRKINLLFLLALMSWLIIFLNSYFLGLLNGFDFSFNLFVYFILTPIICFVLSSRINIERLFIIEASLFWSLVAICLISFYYFGYRVDLYSMPESLVSLNAFGGVKITNEQLELRMASQSSLMFLLPFFMTCFFFTKSKIKKKILSVLLFLGFVIVLFSGRRALQIIFFVGAIFSVIQFLLIGGLSSRKLLNVFFFGVFAAVLAFSAFEILAFYTGLENPAQTFINTVIIAFDSTKGGGVPRRLQTQALIDFWNKSVLFGHGLNSHPYYIRSSAEPWSYEWVYLALLAQAGLIAVTVAFVLIALLFYSLNKRLSYTSGHNRVYILSLLNGLLCFLIVGSSNPMVYFSWIWLLALIPIWQPLEQDRKLDPK